MKSSKSTIILYYVILYFYLCFIPSSFHVVGKVWDNFNLVREGGKGYQRIGNRAGNGPELEDYSLFGWSVASIGDLNQDGTTDMIVGAIGEKCDSSPRCGAVYVLLLTRNATVLTSRRIAKSVNGGPDFLTDNDNYGFAVAGIGDLNKDGILDFAAGAPGTQAGGSVYIHFCNPDGSVFNNTLIRGTHGNGPPSKYFGRFGSALGNLGDMDADGNIELAVQQADFDSGDCKLYILYMNKNGTVKRYVDFQAVDEFGLPVSHSPFSGFGSSVAAIGDYDGDGVIDIAIGKQKNTAKNGAVSGGAIYVCLMLSDGIARYCYAITDTSPTAKPDPLPLEADDFCGTSLISSGDVNRDDLNPLYPDRPYGLRSKNYNMSKIPDVWVGCPQGGQNSDAESSGKVYLLLMTKFGNQASYVEFPSSHDIHRNVSPPLLPDDNFGASVASLMDFDRNGIVDIVVGAPGGAISNPSPGSVYILFIYREEYHKPYFDWIAYWAIFLAPFLAVFIVCVAGIAFFFYKFRRKPDEIEIAVKKAGIEVGLKRKRQKKIAVHSKESGYVDDYS